MQLFYYPQIQIDNDHLELHKEEASHLTRVLRKKTSDQVHVTDGRGNLFIATLGLVTSTRCELNLAFAKANPKPAYQLHIAIAPTKMNDRMEWFLEKATEMGVSRITPIACDHSERKKINVERFEKIIASAMQQSLQCYKPQLDSIIPFDKFVAHTTQGHKYIAHCEDSQKDSFASQLPKCTDVLMLIGPEGDFSSKEIATAIKSGYKPVSLGTNRLRTETAGVYTCAILNGINSF